ncbi:MAG: type II toxin-antitoxin system VapC family toxin [Stenotrophobium sp.]
MANRPVVYWDSDAFLALINGDKDGADLQGCNDVWTAADKGLLHIITSTLTTAEVIHKKGTPKLDPSKRPLVSNFFRQHFISQKPLTREIAEGARDVVWDCGIMPKDAIHVATAAAFRILELHTFDRELLAAKTITVAGFTLQICKPHASAQSEIPLEDTNKSNE